MSAYTDIQGIALQVSRDVVVASIQVDLNDEVLCRFREDLLNRIHQTNSQGVILDLSGLETLDMHEFTSLRRIITMCNIMGAKAVLLGLQPGVVSSLIEAGADVDGLLAATNFDAAFALLEPETKPEETEEDADGEESDPSLEVEEPTEQEQ